MAVEKDRKTAITNTEIDAMTNEELLRLAKTRGEVHRSVDLRLP